MDIDPNRVHAFATSSEFGDWLASNHARDDEIWLKIYKRSSGIASLTWEQAVLQALAWGWIDGLRKANDDTSWFQRFTPRTRRSRWSKVNQDHARQLIICGEMRHPGLRAVLAAQSDGRWDTA